MTTETKALRLAIDAMEYHTALTRPIARTALALAQCRQALAHEIEPPQSTWVGLSENEIAIIHADYPNPQGFAKAIAAKLKEKNTC